MLVKSSLPGNDSIYLLRLYLADDAVFSFPNELDNVADFGRIGHLLVYLYAGVEHGSLSVEHKSVGIGYVFNHFFADFQFAANRRVHTVVGNRAAASYDVRWNVAGKGGSCRYVSGSPYACPGFLNDAGRVDCTVGNLAIACNLGAVAEYAVVAHLGVVADVHAFHKEVVRPDDGLATTVGSTVDNNILSDDVVVADNTLAFFANEVEILWQCTNNAALVYLVSVAYSAAIQNADEWKHDTVVANYHIVFDVNEWKYFAAVAYLRFRRNLGFWTNLTTHTYKCVLRKLILTHHQAHSKGLRWLVT